MASRLVQIPFLPGMHEEIDPAVIPSGALTRAENVRLARDGGLVKRAGSELFDVEDMGPQELNVIDDINGGGNYRDRIAITTAEGRVFSRPHQGDSWLELGRAPRYLPRRSHFLHFDDTVSAVEAPSGAMFTTNGVSWMAITWESGADILLAVLDQSGQRVYQTSVSTRTNPRLIPYALGWLWAYERADNLNVCVRTLIQSTWTLASETSLVTRATTGDAFDIYPDDEANQFILARRASDLALIVDRRPYTAPYASTADHTIVVTNSALTQVSVFALQNSAQSYVGWINNANEAWLSIVNAAMSSSTEVQTGAGDTMTQVAICGQSPSKAWVVYRDSTLDSLLVLDVSTTAVLNTETDGLEGMKLLSRPFLGTGAGFSAWFQNKVYNSTNVYQGHMALCRWNKGSTPALTVELIPDEKPAYVSSEAVPRPLSPPGNVHYLSHGTNSTEGAISWFPALVTLRTARTQAGTAPVPSDPSTTTALMVYEYESVGALYEDFNGGDPVKVEEAAGAGLVYGGGLQEILSARRVTSGEAEPLGSENGFLVSPKLTATASNGSGLTNGALYQGLALFEYIDVDGRRHRSCPSNLASVTINSAQQQITWSWGKHPLTEREVSMEYETIATHIYATAANGSIFYRVTPDTGAPSAVLNTTFVQANNTDTSAEIIYTLGNVKPNFPAPAHRNGLTALGRTWLFGLFNPRLVECSKFFVPNEPATFTRDPAFRSACPIDVDCGVEMDGVIYALGPDGICTIAPGQGPNNQGSPALPPGQLLSRTGCIAPGSVLRIPGGFLFEGRRGMYFLPRGGSEPDYVGASIAETWATAVNVNRNGGVVRSAVLLRNRRVDKPGDATAHIAFQLTSDASFEVACFDAESRRFIGIDTGRAANRLGVLPPREGSGGSMGAGELLVALARNPLSTAPCQVESWIETDADFADDSPLTYTPIEVEITTGWLRPFGLIGHGECQEIALLVTVTDPSAIVYCEMGIDGRDFGDAVPQSLKDYVAGEVAVVRWPVPAGRDMHSIRLRFHDAALGPTGGVGTPQPARVVYHGVTLLVSPQPDLPPQGTSKRVA